MNTKVNLSKLLFASMIFLIGCSNSNDQFKFIDQKNEKQNTMDLYCIDSYTNKDDIIDFCKELKNNYNNGSMHYFVFFDSEEYASFPSNPITGGFIDDSQLKHIKAMFTFNNLNQFSSLTYYEKNELESIPEEIAIP